MFILSLLFRIWLCKLALEVADIFNAFYGSIADYPADNYDGLDSISMKDVIDKHCNHPVLLVSKHILGRKSLSLNFRKSLQIMSLNSSSPLTLENRLVMMAFRINS